MIYRLLADLIVVIHLAYVTFVVAGLLAIVIGAWRQWRWVRNFWLRATHLLAIAIVVFEATFGIVCPLTEWEYQLRELGGQEGPEGSFIGRLVHTVMFYDCPEGVLTIAYVLFGLAVLATMLLVPPRRPPRGKPRCR